jgi:uncharacterized phage-associated protein
MYSIELIAKYIIWLYQQAAERITNLLLQKMCYYAQAWYLANFHKPLLEEDFQAWIYGPVCPQLYKTYKEFGKDGIEIAIDPKELCQISEDDKRYLQDVVAAYSKFSAIELMLMSHEEDPWMNARKGLAADQQCFNVIPKEEIEHYFSERINGESKN